MTLAGLLAKDDTDIHSIARHLDALDAEVRQAEALGLDRAQQMRLWELAAAAPRLRLSHFVPDGTAPGVAVHHPGRNTIPPFRHFQNFEKRFSKQGKPGEVVGYNESAAWFIRPGYFVAYETDAPGVEPDRRARWAERGGVVIDYHLVPEAGSPLPEGWPAVVPNSYGLQRLVYHRTRDFMRGVSEHVSIGRASTGEGEADRMLDFWFVLVRR
jgi:hypothetical protein